MSSLIKSGSELLEARNRETSIPSLGEKFIDPSDSDEIQIRRKNLKDLISEPIVSRRDLLTKGEWVDASGLIWLKNGRGKVPHHMGVLSDKGPCLHPEEAIFLMHCGELEVAYGGMPLSLQVAYALFLQHSHWNYFAIYRHLSSMGCKVHRHQPHLCTTKYEEKIKLNQDIMFLRERKRNKVNLFPTEIIENKFGDTSHDGTSMQSNSTFDEELQKFYSIIKTTEKKEESNDSDVILIEDDAPLLRENKSKMAAFERFPSMHNRNSLVIEVEDRSLLPANSIPSRSSYTISLNHLNYFSKYDNFQNYNNNPYYPNKTKDYAHRHDFQPRKYHKTCDGYNRNHNERQGRNHKENFSHNYDHWSSQNSWNQNFEHGPNLARHNFSAGASKNYSYPSDSSHYDRDKPPWKINRYRRNPLKGADIFPSCLVKSVISRSSSWKEYKSMLRSLTEKTLLKEEPCGALWRGKTQPLITPSHATSLESILSRCVLSKQTSLEKQIICPSTISTPYYDVYLPGIPYKPSEPPLPSARIFISKNENFLPREVLGNIFKYEDNVRSVFTWVVDGLPRMYSITPLNALPD